jgi:hypothetical protein
MTGEILFVFVVIGVARLLFASGVVLIAGMLPIAASAAYVTPVSSPAVTLVVGPGNYRFVDFVKAGIPMLILAIGLACGPGDEATPSTEAPKPDGAAAEATNGTSLELRISPLVDLYCYIRAQAADEDAEPSPGHEAAVEAARAIQRSMGSFGGWGPLDTQVFFAADPQELVQGFGELPEPYERRGGEISIRDDAVRLATALQELLPDFTRSLWPEREAELEGRIAYLDRAFMPKHREALAFMMHSLGIPDPGITVPVFLVNATNPPGAMTYYLRGGAPGCVIDINVGGADDLLLETVLHESSHALDLASRDTGSAFAALRAMLEERGLSRTDEAYHTIPHTLMFVQAEETMRRLFNPGHLAYGDATELYERTGVTADVEREIWPRYLDGELSRDEALRKIVETLDPRPDGD